MRGIYFILAWLTCTSAFACTAFQLKSKDGALIYCRSLEFGFPLESELLIVPRATQFTAAPPAGGLRWQTKYGYVGMNQSFARTLVSDGMNERGLVVGCLYLPGLAQYQAPDLKRLEQSLNVSELASFLLAMCGTVAEVKTALSTLLVVQAPLPVAGAGNFVLPLHFYVSDKNGACLIVEYIEGRLHLHDNPLGVLTNAPSFDWHLTNLANYVNLSAINAPALQLGAWSAKGFGQGSGLLGLPGDYTPPSRFVRAALFSKWASPQKTAIETVRLGFHILNTFDIFDGIIQAKKDTPATDVTEWVIVHDQTNLKTYFRSYESLRIQRVDLSKIHFDQPGFRSIGLEKSFIVDEAALPHGD